MPPPRGQNAGSLPDILFAIAMVDGSIDETEVERIGRTCDRLKLLAKCFAESKRKLVG